MFLQDEPEIPGTKEEREVIRNVFLKSVTCHQIVPYVCVCVWCRLIDDSQSKESCKAENVERDESEQRGNWNPQRRLTQTAVTVEV